MPSMSCRSRLRANNQNPWASKQRKDAFLLPVKAQPRHAGPVLARLQLSSPSTVDTMAPFAHRTTACRTREAGGRERTCFPEWFQKLLLSIMAVSPDKPRPAWLGAAYRYVPYVPGVLVIWDGARGEMEKTEP
ncbi:hypothetical protein E4U53_003197 [Claviceps sorghi]|nr:hypothetical protein E4U53_003197 [Claviceps sorghi]